MNKIEKKRKILEAGIAKHQSVIADFQHSILELKESEVLVNEDERDYQQSSIAEGINDQIARLEVELEFAQDELERLYRIKNEMCVMDCVALGSVVETNKITFFVSASIERFEVDESVIFGLSTASPLFVEMAGKRVGESFSHKGEVYKIIDIY